MWRTIFCRNNFTSAVLVAFCVLFSFAGRGQTSNIKRDHEIEFFPGIAYQTNGVGAGTWAVEFHGCVYEPEKGRIALALLHEALRLENIKLSKTENETLATRTRLFMAEDKGGRKIVVSIHDKKFRLGKSLANGHFSKTVMLTEDEFRAWQEAGLRFHAVLPSKDERLFAGAVSSVEVKGISVISDIDDTIKITDVRDRRATLRNTFVKPFEPVSGMAPAYKAWASATGAQFWYVSASPWQLFNPLQEFVSSNGFPAGVFCLKHFRLEDQSVFSIFQGPEKYKPGVIEPLFRQFPNRRFVLVGDSGERDPEIYGALARKFPGQVIHIYIRNVTLEPGEALRYKTAFQGLPHELWKVFSDPKEILHGLDNEKSE
jgi:phosphatidate phosphatase APP1